MGALDIGRVLTQQLSHLFRLATDDFDRDPCQAILGMMLDDLEIASLGLGLFVRRRAPSPGVFGHLPPGLHHGFPIASLTIGSDGRWRIRMTASLELGHQRRSHFIFILPNGSAYPQARVYVDNDPSPEGAAIIFLWMPPFPPCGPHTSTGHPVEHA